MFQFGALVCLCYGYNCPEIPVKGVTKKLLPIRKRFYILLRILGIPTRDQYQPDIALTNRMNPVSIIQTGYFEQQGWQSLLDQFQLLFKNWQPECSGKLLLLLFFSFATSEGIARSSWSWQSSTIKFLKN